jgi:DNA mismatch endonuclease (patch repair protein)
MKGESKIKKTIKVPRFKKELGFEVTSERSKLMSKIGSKGTKPELKLRKALWAIGLRYRINYKKLKGSPDILILGHKMVIFVDGEFWHGYKWKDKKKKIKTNRGFWIPKIERNIQRDMETNKELRSLGYTVVRFWEHEIEKSLNDCVMKVLAILS